MRYSNWADANTGYWEPDPAMCAPTGNGDLTCAPPGGNASDGAAAGRAVVGTTVQPAFCARSSACHPRAAALHVERSRSPAWGAAVPASVTEALSVNAPCRQSALERRGGLGRAGAERPTLQNLYEDADQNIRTFTSNLCYL